ncbi:hypothetical protein [Spiroplasma endosymbiont of Acasis viretata]|uniref:hypothetical protein n=1 Tax=Spiroplasma endosymbiont of Acasis viretata TaxID=3066306 RepID=UPI00313DCC66
MKTWIKTNLSKITLALALTGATTGTIGLIMGGLLTHENNKFNSYEKPDHTVVLCNAPIWVNMYNGSYYSLYCSNKKLHDVDIKWNGKYWKGYFDN